MTLLPPRLPLPDAAQRTLRQPPLPGMTSPAVGLAAIQLMNSIRSASDHSSAAYRWKTGVSATVRTKLYYGIAVVFASAAMDELRAFVTPNV